MQFNVANVVSIDQMVFTGKLLGYAIAVKVLPCLLFLFGVLTLWNALNTGLLMTSRLSLIIVAATLGMESGFITEAFKDAIILLAVITCLMGPSLFKVFYKGDDLDNDGDKIERRKLSAGRMR